ncbi:MAG: division plane positioning ATPase MipZ [Rhodospirillales bacterium]|nr:division plane positioning ATPase MipZ [Rhodospirillales bacterium]
MADREPSEGAVRPYVIALGNEKGGTGKSTTALHLAVALLKLGYSVGTLDLDGRQGTLSRGLANRAAWAEAESRRLTVPLVMPRHERVAPSEAADPETARKQDRKAFDRAVAAMAGLDFVVVDTPGSSSGLARLGHQWADTLITPLNDSLVDIDVLAEINVARREVLAPSVYTKLVWEQNNLRVVEGRAPIDWIVMRNRLSHLDARNKREVAALLAQLAKRIGFRVTPGFGERVVFRELFDRGLTVLDLPELPGLAPARPSHAAARREIEALLAAIGVEAELAA